MVGLDITGELEPSHQLLDLMNHQYETGVLVWVPPSRCSKRESQILTGFKQHTLKVEESIIKLGHVQAHVECDVSDSLRVQWALMRRGLAMDQCKLVTWTCQQKWVQRLMDSLSQVPPPGYMAIAVGQCVRADKEFFLLLAREATQVDRVGASPLFLLPFPKRQASSSAAKTETPDRETVSPKVKAKTKAKAKRRNRLTKAVPEELKAFRTRTDKGECICWNFNMQVGCSNGKNGKCNKGLRVCTYCHKPGHSVVNCRSKGSG